MQSPTTTNQTPIDLRTQFQILAPILAMINPGTSDLIITPLGDEMMTVFENENGSQAGLMHLWHGAYESPLGQAALLARNETGFLLLIARRGAEDPEYYLGRLDDDGLVWTEQLSPAEAIHAILA